MQVSEDEQRLREKLAENVKRARDRLLLTQREAAERADVEERHWQKIEAAEVGATLRMLTKLARALRVSASSLLA